MTVQLARMIALSPTTLEEVTICVTERDDGSYRVFVDGGFLSNGNDDYTTDDLLAALFYAACEVRACIED